MRDDKGRGLAGTGTLLPYRQSQPPARRQSVNIKVRPKLQAYVSKMEQA